MFSFQIKTKQTQEEQRKALALRMRAAGIMLVALLLAWSAWTQLAFPMRFTYAVVVFCLVFFGAIWVETLYRRLLRYPTNHNKFVGWFFAACVTAWWVGVEIRRYASAIRSGDVSFMFLDYTSWVTYASLAIILVAGYVGLKLVRKNVPLSEQREYYIIGVILASLVVLGAVVSFLIPNS